MTALSTFNILLCIACCLRLMLFARCGAVHRPWASLVAYLLTVAFGASAVLTAFGSPCSWPQTILHVVFALALHAVHGNVVALFRPASGNRQPFIVRLLRRASWTG